MSNEEQDTRRDNPKPRRRHRLRRAVIVILLLLVVIVAAGPYIASTGPVEALIVSAANSHFYGTFQIDDISLNWMGPCVVKGLRVTDTSDREVLHVEQIIWEHGAWRGVTDYEKIGHVKVIKPDPTLIVGPDGKISLTEALKPRKPTEKKPLPELFGKITVRDGSVKVILANGAEGKLSGLDAQFDLNTLKDVAGEFSWDSVEMYDMVLGKAEFKPTFRNERLDLPVATIPVSTVPPQKDAPPGFLRIGCEIDFSGDEPMLKMPGTLQVAENIPINREFGSDVLSRMIPLFYEPKKLTGQVSLTIEDLNVPLGKSIKHTGSGRGRVGLKDIDIQSDGLQPDGLQPDGLQPDGLLTGLTKLGGLGTQDTPTSVKISDLVFAIKDGRFYYDDLAVIFAGTLDMKFSGSVGFDDTLDLVVALPVIPMQIEQFGKIVSLEKFRRGIGLDKLSPILDNVPIVGKRRHLKFRIIGTRKKPKLSLLSILDLIIKPDVKPEDRPEIRPDTQPATQPVDIIFDLLGELLKPKPPK
ncbi:MAG: hypothetical protein KAV00_10815 [Phycisphaerae bacterium]|nr:hypothetical protein [Phycisphaerae bacterium]